MQIPQIPESVKSGISKALPFVGTAVVSALAGVGFVKRKEVKNYVMSKVSKTYTPVETDQMKIDRLSTLALRLDVEADNRNKLLISFDQKFAELKTQAETNAKQVAEFLAKAEVTETKAAKAATSPGSRQAPLKKHKKAA